MVGFLVTLFFFYCVFGLRCACAVCALASSLQILNCCVINESNIDFVTANMCRLIDWSKSRRSMTWCFKVIINLLLLSGNYFSAK